MDPKKYWDERYKSGGNSGYGSYDEQLTKKLNWLKGLDIKTVTEIGCGDFNFGSNLMALYPDAVYSGCDISPYVLERNRNLYPQHNFYPAGGYNPPGDLLLCIDVLFHVLDAGEYENLLWTLERTWTKYLAVTAYERDEVLGNHVRIRSFDYKRFGEPIIREIVEEDGQLYFYLFKRPDSFSRLEREPETRVDWSKVSCCLNTKEAVYPWPILHELSKVGFGEILINTHSDSPYKKFEMINKAKFELIYYQDDDALCPVGLLDKYYEPGKINVLMKPSHIEQYKNRRMTMGLGWGCLLEKRFFDELLRYQKVYGTDDVFRRDTEKLLTEIVGPEKQNRIEANVIDLSNAMAPGRLSMQAHHYSNMDIITERVKAIL